MKKELAMALVVALAVSSLVVVNAKKGEPGVPAGGNPGSTWLDITETSPVGTSGANAPSCNSVNCCDEECNAEGVCLEPAEKLCETPTDLATCECEEYDEITGECIACAPQCCFACDDTCVGDAI